MLKTVTRALQLLQVLGANPDGMSLAELAGVEATNKQDAFRLVKALAAFQFVSNDARTGKIILGSGILHLAEKVKTQLDLWQIAVPTLTKLRDKTGETACLHVRAADKRVCITQVESLDELRCVSNIGQGLPLITGAPGRVFLAYLPPGERSRLLKSLNRLTDQTIVDCDGLLRLIENLRRDGYTVARDETVSGMAAVSAPVFDPSGNVIAAVTLLGPSQRLTRRRLTEHAAPVREAARQVSEILSYGSDGRPISARTSAKQ